MPTSKRKTISYDKVMKQVLHNDDVLNWPSLYEAERETGVKRQNILSCCHGKTKSAGGYIWKIKE